MKKIIILFLLSIVIIFSSCKTVPKCAAYGETHKFQNTFKINNKRVSSGKSSCPAYGEAKKFQKGNKSYRKLNKYNYSCPAYGEHKKFQKSKKNYSKNRGYTYNSPSGRLNQGTIRESLLH